VEKEIITGEKKEPRKEKNPQIRVAEIIEWPRERTQPKFCGNREAAKGSCTGRGKEKKEL